MSLHYILDGYNISNQMPVGAMDSLEDQRNNLVSLIETSGFQGSSRNKVTIVFDGISGLSSGFNMSSVNIVFSRDETADDKIKRIVDEASNQSSIIVVTNDRSIQYAVRASGAKILSVEEFLSKCSGVRKNVLSRQGKKKSVGEDVKSISKVIESKITSEMRKIWLQGQE